MKEWVKELIMNEYMNYISNNPTDESDEVHSSWSVIHLPWYDLRGLLGVKKKKNLSGHYTHPDMTFAVYCALKIKYLSVLYTCPDMTFAFYWASKTS